MSLDELFQKKGMRLDVGKVMSQLKKTAQTFGLEFGDRQKTFDSRPAQELGVWAEKCDRGGQYHIETFKAYFVSGRNIAKTDVLMEIVEKCGLAADEALKVIQDRPFSNIVDQDWKLASQKQVTAVPTFFMGLDRLVGAQPYERLAKMVERNVLFTSL